ncbi:MAG: regulatory iron-sulfur-containing complex subunit RicT [Anaerovoracaceae bacterium]|jgi:cell fate regulator YaaT (PSP1 superfamily)
MADIVGVKFRTAGKIYYFDAAGYTVHPGDEVIVETQRGMEFGTVALGIGEIHEQHSSRPLKKIVRMADEEDREKHRAHMERKQRDLRRCQEKIEKHHLEMKLIDVEYTLDDHKIIFYFTADGRVDFRALVKDLAGVFRMRIELRQIGVRDEAKMMGGISNCGRGLCCHEWLRDFQPVSIKMAKTQNLSLNPSKISGICGRLMCCLKFENELYTELRKDMPGTGERVRIPEGTAVVTDSNILAQKVSCRTIVEDRDDEEGVTEKLSTEVYVYSKDDVERLEHRGKDRHRRGRGSRGGHRRTEQGGEGNGAADAAEKTFAASRRDESRPDGEPGAAETASARSSAPAREGDAEKPADTPEFGSSRPADGAPNDGAPRQANDGASRHTEQRDGQRSGRRRRRRRRRRKKPAADGTAQRPAASAADGERHSGDHAAS